jgi:protein-disulfide isomerase
MKKIGPFLLIAVVLILSVIAIVMLLRSGSETGTFTEGTPEPGPKPPAKSTVTLEEFGDYQCPPCGLLHPTLKSLKSEFGGNLNFVFRSLPLTNLHKNAMLAAQTAEAARVQSRFWEMHDLLYENQKLWSEEADPKPIFLKFARDLGLDTTRFERDLNSDEVKMRITADQDAAAKQGITGTPTILVDGRRLRVEATTPDGIRTIIVAMTRRPQPAP